MRFLDENGLQYFKSQLDRTYADAKHTHSSRFCEKVLLYYGYPIALNGLWDVDKCAKAYGKYDICIFGDGYNEPSHETYNDTLQIFNTILDRYKDTRIVGYVPIGVEDSSGTGLTEAEIKSKIDKWIVMGVHGIFLDEFGYDYKVTRERQNNIVDYCHDHNLFVFANSWSTKYCFSNDNMILDWIPGFLPNPDGLVSHLGPEDYCVYEHMFYSAELEDNGNLVVKCANPSRITDAINYYTEPKINGKSYYEVYGTKLFTLNGIPSTFTDDQKRQMMSVCVLAAAMFNLDAIAFGDEHWGSSGYYDDWDMPNTNLASKKFNKIDIETKKDSSGNSFPYKWSTLLNGVYYELVCEYSSIDDLAYYDNKQYVSCGGDKVSNAWISVYNLGNSFKKLDDTMANYIDRIETALDSSGSILYSEVEW